MLSNNDGSSFQQETPHIQNSLDGCSEMAAPEFKIEKRPKRKHGFSWPCHCAQLSTLLSIGLNFTIFFLYLIDYILPSKIPPFFDKQTDIFAFICSIIGTVSIIFVIYNGIRATVIDPEDRLIAIQEECNRMNQSFEDEKYEYYCQICCMCVNEGSKHCRTCNKCVEAFDHHCYWLNNCIGGKNYYYFFRLLSFSLLAFVAIISM